MTWRCLAPRRTAAAALLTILTACGGGGGGAALVGAQAAALSSMTDSPTVRIEGCVVAHDFSPLQQDVQALSADGRLAQTSRSDHTGVFLLRVPAKSAVRLRLSRADDPLDELTVSTGSTDMSVGACLIDFSRERSIQ